MTQFVYESWKSGAVIRNERNRRDMSVLDLSVITGISVSHLCQIEQGNRRMGMNVLFKLMNVFEADANTLLAVPVCDNNVVSIDLLLATLPLKYQEYYRNLFEHMIRDIPS